MTTPTITIYPDTLPAKGQSNDAFDVNIDNFLTWLTATNGPELAAMITFTDNVRYTVLATALAGNLPPLTGQALKLFRVNAAENGGEFRTPAQVKADIGLGGITDNSTANAITIDSTGNLLVGKTVSDTASDGIELRGIGQLLTASKQGGAALLINRNGVNGDAVLFNKTDSLVGSISVTASATAYNTSSDYRLKENITPVQGAADIVKMMRPCTYTAKSDGLWYDGFLAHELQEVHPRAVQGAKDAMKEEDYEITPAVLDAQGGVLTEAIMGTRSVPDMQSVDYSKLTPILTAALQEALAKIDALTARIDALEGEA